MGGIVQATIDWHTASPTQLDGRRCIITTTNGTIIDGHLKAHPPTNSTYATTRFTLDDTEQHLQGFHILSIDARHHTRILQPHIRTLTITEGVKPMSIIDQEITRQHDNDPTYLDSDLQNAWAQGYKACSRRTPTDQEIEVAARRLHELDCTRNGLLLDTDAAWNTMLPGNKAIYRLTAKTIITTAQQTALQ
ncbi:hypothetical protein [Bifidobacterium biavatii]|nr:hypothetical protein [Bifidobacterium biavatii]